MGGFVQGRNVSIFVFVAFLFSVCLFYLFICLFFLFMYSFFAFCSPPAPVGARKGVAIRCRALFHGVSRVAGWKQRKVVDVHRVLANSRSLCSFTLRAVDDGDATRHRCVVTGADEVALLCLQASTGNACTVQGWYLL